MIRMHGTAVALAAILAACSSPGGPEDSGTVPGEEIRRVVDVESPEDAATAVDAREVAPGAEVVPDQLEACEAGAQQCLDEKTVAVCNQGSWLTTQVCSDEQLCLDGLCVPAEECQAGHVKGCYSLAARNVCHSSGKGYVPYYCTDGKKCVEGKCSELTCTPGVRQCTAPDAWQECLPDGSGWTEPALCEDGEACVGGQCLSGCSGDIKYNQSNVGCEFWSADLGQWDQKEGESSLDPPASGIPHAVVVGNPNALPVKVTFEVGDGTPVEVPDPVVPAGQSRAFLMPVLSLQYTSITQKTIRLRTNHPVTAAQFNPPTNEDFVHTSDASLLYPISILGKEHYVVTTASHEGPDFPIIGKSPSVWGYVTVLAVEPGTTTVTVGPLTVATEPGEGIPGYEEGEILEVTLEQWEVLHLESLAGGLFEEPEDLTGTRVLASQKVAVFAGHDCDVLGDSNCDHLETQLLPLEAWGNEYVAGRMETPAPNQYRVVSGADDNAITTNPPIGELNGATLQKGEWRHVESNGSFQVTGTGPLQVIQFIAGNSSYGSVLVDPSMTTLVPVSQFRTDYPLLVPTAYEKDWVCIVREKDTPLLLNGQPLNAYFTTIPGTDWQVGNVEVSAGINQVTGDSPFGLISYGYASKVSYAYPGGLNGAPAE